MEKWITEKRLEFSEELGDLVRPYSPSLALSIYMRGHAPHKVVQCFADQGEFENMILYAQKAGFQPDYLFQLRQVLRTDPAKGLKFAQLLVAEGRGQPLVDINQVSGKVHPLYDDVRLDRRLLHGGQRRGTVHQVPHRDAEG